MKFIKEIMSEENQGSFTRVSGLLLIVGYIASSTLILYHGDYKVEIPQIPSTVLELIIWLYGINKIGGTIIPEVLKRLGVSSGEKVK